MIPTPPAVVVSSPRSKLQVQKRDGQPVDFNADRIFKAIERAFRADLGLDDDERLPTGTVREVERLTMAVTDRCLDAAAVGQSMDIEKIQDLVETELMRAIHFTVARRYILYREERRKARAQLGPR